MRPPILAIILALAACKGGAVATCGAGTHDENGTCVVTLRCGAGTHQSGADCIPDGTIACGSGTHLSGGSCVPDAVAAETCAPGTHDDGGACVADVYCGPGSHADGGACVPNVLCGAGAHVDGGACVADVVCGDGSHPDGGACMPDTVCGAGTYASGGACVPDSTGSGATYQVRLLSQDVAADGYSKVPVLVIGTNADGTPATDSMVMDTSLAGAGGFSTTSFALPAMGEQLLFTPCSSANAGCSGTFQITAALATAPNTPVASSWPLTLRAPAGVGSDTPCLAGGNVVFFDGDSTDYIHPGTETITAGTFSATGSANTVDLSVTPSAGGWWYLDFSSAQLGQALAAQVYDDAQRAPFASPGHPGLEISGSGRGCNTLTGAFQVEDLQWNGSTLASFTATFEQHCEGGAAALRGCIHYAP